MKQKRVDTANYDKTTDVLLVYSPRQISVNTVSTAKATMSKILISNLSIHVPETVY